MERKGFIRMICLLGILLFRWGSVTSMSCDEQPVKVDSFTLVSELWNETLDFSVYVPPCTDERVIDGYPVLYLLHGQDMGREIWEEIGMSETLRQGLTERSLPLFYVVVPEEKNYLESLSISHFGNLITDELIPWMTEHYPVRTDRDGRAIGGISRGALWAETLVFTHPELFSSVGLHSMPGVPFGDMDLFYIVKDHTPEDALRIRFDSGTLDGFRTEAQRAFAQLDTLGLPVSFFSFPGEHDTEYWRSQLKNSLEWYADAWK